MHHGAALPARAPLSGRRHGPAQGTAGANRGMCEALHPRGITPSASSPTEKALGVLVDVRLTVRHQGAFVAKQASGFLDRVRKSHASRLRGVILRSFPSALHW